MGDTDTTWTVDSLAAHLGVHSLWSADTWRPHIAAAVHDGLPLEWIADHCPSFSPNGLEAARHVVVAHRGPADGEPLHGA